MKGRRRVRVEEGGRGEEMPVSKAKERREEESKKGDEKKDLLS